VIRGMDNDREIVAVRIEENREMKLLGRKIKHEKI
jgi:hypothetical protein